MTEAEQFAEALVPNIDWKKDGKVHNWRNYVGKRTRALWDTLTPEQKIAIAADADARASKEEWD